MDLSTARVLVTGGSSGIGQATARRLAAAGARVAICGRNAAALRAAAKDVGATPVEADVSREADVARLVSTVIRELGGYDTLINNAGFGRFAPLIDMTAADFRAVWETNVLGAMLVARDSARHFVQQRRGNIVNVASTSGQRGGAGGTAYSSSKFALSGLTDVWRTELRQYDVRVMLPRGRFTSSATTGGRPSSWKVRILKGMVRKAPETAPRCSFDAQYSIA